MSKRKEQLNEHYEIEFYQLARADTRISMVGVRQITIDHQSIGYQDGSRN